MDDVTKLANINYTKESFSHTIRMFLEYFASTIEDDEHVDVFRSSMDEVIGEFEERYPEFLEIHSRILRSVYSDEEAKVLLDLAEEYPWIKAKSEEIVKMSMELNEKVTEEIGEKMEAIFERNLNDK